VDAAFVLFESLHVTARQPITDGLAATWPTLLVRDGAHHLTGIVGETLLMELDRLPIAF
jgi:hypothetical protein